MQGYTRRGRRLDPRPDTEALLEALDHLEVGLALYDDSGERLFENESLRRRLAGEPAGGPLARGLAGLVAEILERLEDHTIRSFRIERLEARELRTASGVVLLRASHIGMDLCGTGATLLLTVEGRAATGLPGEEELRARYGLTPAQARVALLLAERRKNAEIARELCISENTARNHTRVVLQRLRVGRRGEVGERLTQR